MTIQPHKTFDVNGFHQQFSEIRKNVEAELIQKAEQIANRANGQVDYCTLANEGIKTLERRIAMACPNSQCPCAHEAFVARVVIGKAKTEFNSLAAFGGKLKAILNQGTKEQS